MLSNYTPKNAETLQTTYLMEIATNPNFSPEDLKLIPQFQNYLLELADKDIFYSVNSSNLFLGREASRRFFIELLHFPEFLKDVIWLYDKAHNKDDIHNFDLWIIRLIGSLPNHQAMIDAHAEVLAFKYYFYRYPGSKLELALDCQKRKQTRENRTYIQYVRKYVARMQSTQPNSHVLKIPASKKENDFVKSASEKNFDFKVIRPNNEPSILVEVKRRHSSVPSKSHNIIKLFTAVRLAGEIKREST